MEIKNINYKIKQKYISYGIISEYNRRVHSLRRSQLDFDRYLRDKSGNLI